MENDVFGEAVNITARIEGIAEAGQVYFTEAVYLSMNKAEVPSSEIGLMQLKGIPEKIRVYKVRLEEPVGASAAPERPRFFGLLTSRAAVLPSGAKAALATAGVPSTVKRFAALLLDVLFVWLLVSALTGQASIVRFQKAPIKNGAAVVQYDGKNGRQETPDEDDAPSPGGFALAWFLYQMVFLKRLGATPGKRLLNLKVVSLDGAPLDKKQRTMRAAVSILSGYVGGLGYLWALFEPQRRGWHDLMADSRVVSAD